jgi:hypothetical protein
MGHRDAWRKFRPNSNQELEDALMVERMLTQKWYQRMSGKFSWGPGERDLLNSAMDIQAQEINGMMRKSLD